MRLDDFVASRGLERVDLIKIDVQGAEPLLLQGAMRTLAEFGPDLLVEVSPIDLQAFGSGPRELLEPLVACGYRLFDLDSTRLVPRSLENIGPEFASDNLYCTMRDPVG